jgi:xylulose-5-phosphate/fructose-6-phosphate phosphoketolase
MVKLLPVLTFRSNSESFDVIDRVPGLGTHAAYTKQALRDKLIEHRQYITLHGEDMPEVREWTWPY